MQSVCSHRTATKLARFEQSIGNQLALARVQPTSFLSQEWSLCKRRHGKASASREEEARRFANSLITKAHVKRHNADPNKSAHMQVNHLSD